MIYRFGSFELNEAAGELRRAGEAVPIQPKPLALLALLIRERERVVSSDELFAELWAGAAVTPSSLTRAVSHARRAIDDTGKSSLLRSVPRRGYRFVGDVQALAGAGQAPPPVTAPQRARSGFAFVGRDDALETLRAAWAQARDGHGGLVLIDGAAGIGKTRLTEVFAEEASAQGAQFVFGRCHDGEGVPAFWLWSQLLRGLSDAGMGTAECDWDALLAGAGNASDPEQRFRFFDSVLRALEAAARARPVVFVLEDLHWARPTSLRLLEHVVFGIGGSRIFLIATVRSEASERNRPVERTLSILRRNSRCEWITLKGLSRAAVGDLLADVIGDLPPAELTSELFVRTEGVPLFVREAVRLLDERGDLKRPERIRVRGITLPDHAVDFIGRSLDSLSDDSAAIVGAGSVLGREFSLSHVAAVAERDRESVLDLLDEAVGAGVLETVTDAAATYRFTHALHREAAYLRHQPGERARLHARAAARLEAQYADDPSPVLAELAHHHHQGIAVGDPELAFARATAAAEKAHRLFAYEQASSHYEQALDALAHLEVVDPTRRLETLLELGEAHRRAGDRPRRREVCALAMEGARALGWGVEFAQAAIGFCDVSEWSPEDEAADAAVDEALAGLASDEVALRARLTARRAYLDIRDPGSRGTARQAVALARRRDDPEALQEALYVLHYSVAGPDHFEERRSLIPELVEAARRSHNRGTTFIALLDVACDFLTLGDPEGAQRMSDQARELGGPSPTPGMAWHLSVFDTGCALLAGRLGDIEQRTMDALLIGKRIAHPYARACFNGQRMQLHRYRGEHAAIRPLFARALDSTLGPNHWSKAVVARNELALGEVGLATELFEELAAEDFADIARGIRWIGTLVELAHLCADLGDARRAATLCRILEPVEHQHGVLPVPILYAGPVAWALARLKEARSLADEALEHYEQALEAATIIGGRPVQVFIRNDLAALLERRGVRRRAAAVRSEARALADAIGVACPERAGST